MEGGNGRYGSETSHPDDRERLWQLFVRTGFPCALRALRELERREERVAALQIFAAEDGRRRSAPVGAAERAEDGGHDGHHHRNAQ